MLTVRKLQMNWLPLLSSSLEVLISNRQPLTGSIFHCSDFRTVLPGSAVLSQPGGPGPTHEGRFLVKFRFPKRLAACLMAQGGWSFKQAGVNSSSLNVMLRGDTLVIRGRRNAG